MPGVDNVPFLTNAGILNPDVMSEHLAVVGGSYVGLEFAQTYRRFGSRVTVVEQGDRLVAREDEDISVTLQKILEAEGIDIRLSATCIGLRRTPQGVAVSVDCAQGGRRSTARMCCWPWVTVRILTISASMWPVSRPTSAASSPWTIGAGPTSLASERSESAVGVARSRTRRTTITRSLRRIYSTATRGGSAIAFPATPCIPTRRSAEWASPRGRPANPANECSSVTGR